MTFSIILIAVLSYALCLPDIFALVSVYGFQDDIRRYGTADYAGVRSRFGVVGLIYTLVIDLVRALIAVLIGSIALKNAGYPELGRHLVLFFTVFFMLMGQAFPALPALRPRRSMVYPALLLLFADWRIFLICAVLSGALFALTRLAGLSALAAAVILPVFSLIFRNWGLFSFLLLLSGLSLVFAYLDELWTALRLLPERLEDVPRRLRLLGAALRRRIAENAHRLEEEERENDSRK